MTRRTVFSRILGAVGFAVAAKALPSYPEAGQAVPVNAPNIKPPEPVKAEAWPTKQWWELPAKWLGDPLDHNIPLSCWHRECGPFTDEEYAEAFNFVNGLGQWDPDVVQTRNQNGRISLVMNKIAQVHHRATAVSMERGESLVLTHDERRKVYVNLYRRNRDAQRVYNYTRSMQAEMYALHPPRRVIQVGTWTGSDWKDVHYEIA